jgi:FAD/FMN-containing dehydrogenase
VLFGDNYPRLQALKKKYDPDMLFSKWFVITPA